MWIGWIEFDLLLGEIRSLKEKRAAVRPLIAELRRFGLSVAEVDHLDLYRRAGVGIGCVSAQRVHLTEVLDNAERLVAARPEFQLLSAHRSIASSADED
jgi:uncharacterized protein